MRDLVKTVSDRILVYDGSKGIFLQRMGLSGGDCGDIWNIRRPKLIREIYEIYKNAGSDIIQTNTFTANRYALDKYGFGKLTYDINYKAAVIAREVMGDDGLVAGAIGPVGVLLEPYGDLSEEDAVNLYYEQARALADGGVDAINLETFMDEREAVIAVQASKRTGLPVICCMTFNESGRTIMGNTPAGSAKSLVDAGAQIVGANCSVGPQGMVNVIKEISEAVEVPLCVKPNAGMPKMINGEVTFDAEPEAFSRLVPDYIAYGAKIIGGCCGTDDKHIKEIKIALLQY